MKSIKKICLLLLILIGLGCSKDFLNESPKTFTNPQNLMKSKNGVEQAVNGIYNATADLYRTRNVHLMYTITTDEVWGPTLATGDRWDMMTYNFNSANGNILFAYQSYVTGISRANMVLDNLPPTGALGIPGEKAFLDYKKGEALFLRAWLYFKHMSTFGTVPLITTFNKAELFPANSPIEAIYAQIIADLLEAEKLLPNWKSSIAEPGRASRGAAKSLLGIVYLTRATSEAKAGEDFQNAASKLKEVIDKEGYDLWDNYTDVFIPANKNKKEDIFSNQSNANTSFPSTTYTEFVLTPAPTGASRGYGYFSVTDLIYNTFESMDKRRSIIQADTYIVRSTGQIVTTPYHYTEKYLDPVNGPLSYNNFSTNMPLIRYADVLLSYSEAVNGMNNGPNNDAYSGINKVRGRAGLDPLSNLNKEQFFEAIVLERAHEFFGEAIRWFDLKRWGLLERAELRKSEGPNIKDINVQLPKNNVFPFPLSEIDANPNLKQNPGY